MWVFLKILWGMGKFLGINEIQGSFLENRNRFGSSLINIDHILGINDSQAFFLGASLKLAQF